MAGRAATTFDEALSRAPMRMFQWVTVLVCMLALISDGIDMQLLGIISPLIVADFGVDRGTFGFAVGAALVGFGIGAFSGGVLGDRIGRRYALVIATLIFALATAGASLAGGVWSLALWRILGGIGFGAVYANALTMASEWVPERIRPVTLSTLSVGTPLGGTVVGWLGPLLAASYGWRSTFLFIGLGSLLLVVIIIAVLRDSPSFLMLKGRTVEAERTARLVGAEDLELSAGHAGGGAEGPSIGVLDATNTRFNIGVGLAFAAFAICAYAILNWTTTYLLPRGFTLAQGGQIISIAGITSMVGSVLAGILTRQFGSKRVMIGLSITLLLIMLATAYAVEALPVAPTETERLIVLILIGTAGAVFSAGIAMMYVIMAAGYSQSCRSAGIGFGIFMSRVGAISGSTFGGALLDLGHGSVIPFFAVLCVSALLVCVAAVIIDRHVPPLGKA
ncbi:MAG: MFS transporter [Sphingobium sp.]|nr:MFS transporter [Sphingobium sp.]